MAGPAPEPDELEREAAKIVARRKRKRDQRRQTLMNAAAGLASLLILVVVAAAVAPYAGLELGLGITIQTALLAVAVVLLSTSSFLFARIDWRRLRPEGARIVDRARSDLVLTMVSLLALTVVLIMGVVEVGALLFFLGVIADIGSVGSALAQNFVLLQTIVLLVVLMTMVSRQQHTSSYEPTTVAKTFAGAMTILAAVSIVAGVALAFGLPQGAGLLANIEVHQGVYVVTLGVLLEFLAIRIRLSLPGVWYLAKNAVTAAQKATPDLREVMQKRAIRTYVAAIVFVAISMAFAGAVLTGSVGLQSRRTTIALVVFYAGAGMILLGIVAVRLFQSVFLGPSRKKEGDALSLLVQQRKRSPEEIFRIAVYGATGFLALVSFAIAILSGLDLMPWSRYYGTDAFILAVLFAAGPYGFFYNKELKRRAALDEKFPDFLRDIAESARAGMTLPRALVTAAKGTYGPLTPDIKKMAAQVEWGVAFGDALTRFAGRARTPLIDRTVSLVVEAQRAGGSMVDILTAASDDAREIKQIVSERNQQMAMYNVVIYIAFFVFIAVVLVLSAQFLPAFKAAVAGAEGQQVGGIQFKDFSVAQFNNLFLHAALVQAIGGGLVGGVLTRGHPVAGFTHVGIMMAAAWFSFRVVVALL